MKKVKVAIIDTGIDKECKYLSKLQLSGFGVSWDSKAIITDLYDDKNGHGTACTSIIYKECNNVEFIVVNALGKRGKTNILVIEKALSNLIDMEIDIINMSFAISQSPGRELYNICKNLTEKNKILVASTSNNNTTIGFPACFDIVYGVKCGVFEDDKSFRMDSSVSRGYVVNNVSKMCANLHNKFQLIQPNNSISTARFTGILCDIISENEIEKQDYRYLPKVLKSVKRYDNIRKYNHNTEWYISDKNELLCNIYELLSDKIMFFKTSNHICDYELLTSRGNLKYNEVYGVLSFLSEQLKIEINYMEISRYDLLSLGTLTKLFEFYGRVV